MYHLNYTTLFTEHAESTNDNFDTWFCEKCSSSLYSFHHMEIGIDLIYFAAYCYYHLKNCSCFTHFLFKIIFVVLG